MELDLSFLTVLQAWLQTTDLLDLFLKGVLGYVAIFWLALLIWVTRDVIHRSNSIIFQAFAILLNTILPIFGLVIYLFIRPSKTLLDSYYDEMEIKALGNLCPKCSASVENDFIFCPDCGDSLRKPCNSCEKESFVSYKICPFCGEKKNKKKKIEKKKTNKEA